MRDTVIEINGWSWLREIFLFVLEWLFRGGSREGDFMLLWDVDTLMRVVSAWWVYGWWFYGLFNLIGDGDKGTGTIDLGFIFHFDSNIYQLEYGMSYRKKWWFDYFGFWREYIRNKMERI